MKKQLFFLMLSIIGFSSLMNAQVPSYVPTSGLVAYWGFSGNANDSSGNNYNGTVNNATLTTDRFGNANSAYSFNGSSCYIAVPHNAAFNTQQATWNVWVKKTSSSTGNGMYIFGKRDNAQHHVTFCSGSTTGNCQLGWATSQSTGINGGDITNGWHLISLTYDQSISSNNLKLYYDGTLQGTATIQSFTFANGDIRFGIEMNNSYWQAFNGLIDDASIYNRILSQTEIQQLYSGTTAVASCPSLSGTLSNGLIAYYPFCGNANDASGNNNNGTVNGATLTADRFGNANCAYSFNGTSNYIRCLNAGVTGSNSRSVAFWVKTSSTSPGSIISYGNNDTSSQDFRVLLHGLGISCGANTEISCTITGSGRGVQYASNNNWDFFTIVYDNTLGTNLSIVKIYKNGILASSYCDENSTNTLNTGSTNPLTIGCYHWLSYSGNKQYFSGILDDIALWNRALTQDEVSTLYGQNICYQSVTVTDTLIINTGILSYNPITYNNTITIYPNPANDHITIDCGTLTNVVGYSIKITNTLGQEVFNQPMNTQQYYVPLNSWTGQGVYFVNIINAQGNIIDVRKIILQ